ncbi:hypothetical protein [Bacillus ndiopicus]|uniref:hypothetical protein n=1 Tax=Bacillus ndiopicus TaxID=1347368 RepID=UPI0005A89E77|nr:hypothetical protein [Bacillus ndiopicus]
MYKYTSRIVVEYLAYDNQRYVIDLQFAVNVSHILADKLFLQELGKRGHNLKDTPTLNYYPPIEKRLIKQ